MEEAGVSYADIVSGDAEGVVELYDPDQGARIKKFDVTDKIASDFFMMFCRGRKDVYDLRYTNPKTGKNGYYTQCFNRWDRGCHIQKKRMEFVVRIANWGIQAGYSAFDKGAYEWDRSKWQ